MRPRVITRGKVWTPLSPTSSSNRFNEAARDHARKAGIGPPLTTGLVGFNEAARDHARKEITAGSISEEQTASMRPRVITRGKESGSDFQEHKHSASMRPRVITRGKAA